MLLALENFLLFLLMLYLLPFDLVQPPSTSPPPNLPSPIPRLLSASRRKNAEYGSLMCDSRLTFTLSHIHTDTVTDRLTQASQFPHAYLCRI